MLNIGMRYEHYTVSKDVYDRSRVFDIVRCQGFCPNGTPWFFRDNDNIAPRILLAYAPKFPGGKTVFALDTDATLALARMTASPPLSTVAQRTRISGTPLQLTRFINTRDLATSFVVAGI